MINRSITLLLTFLFFLYSILIYDYLFVTSIGLSFTLYIFLQFINKLGKEVPIKEFVLLLASFQWIVGAKISYNLGKQHYKYYMYVDETTYMNYVVPAVLLFFIGLNLFRSNMKISHLESTILKNSHELKKTALTLIILGLSSAFLSRFTQGGLTFILFLGEILLYIGVGYTLYLYRDRKYLILLITLGVVFILAINKGSFHKLLLVGSFLLFFAIPPTQKFIQKVFLVILGVGIVYVIQLVKNDLRDIIWKTEKKENALIIFWDLIKEEFKAEQNNYFYLNNDEVELKEQAELNVRMNQGWIISKTLENVPKNTPFENGRTIRESIEASILPRFLFPDKLGASHGLDNFKKITGLYLNDKTSMELSIVAEFYANYGRIGGQFAMLLYGLLVALLIKYFTTKLGEGSEVIYLWLILFFFQPVKAEIDLIKILNHFVKSIIFFWLIKYFLTNVLRIAIVAHNEEE